jgi:hypothetical protein
VLAIVVTLVLLAGGCVLVTIAARSACRRLGLDPWETLVWLGLTEAPHDELAAKRAEPVMRRRTATRAA